MIELIKELLKSKTVWLGLLMAMAGISEYLAGLPAGSSGVQIASGILTIVIRTFTSQPIKGTWGAKIAVRKSQEKTKGN